MSTTAPSLLGAERGHRKPLPGRVEVAVVGGGISGVSTAYFLAKEGVNVALFSEHAVYAAQSRWEKQEIIPETKIPPDDLARIAQKFDQFAARWSTLPIGGSVDFEWNHDLKKQKR